MPPMTQAPNYALTNGTETTVGSLLVGMRTNANISQEQMALKLHVHVNSISNWEKGIHLPDIVSFIEYIRACGAAVIIRQHGVNLWTF